MRTLLIKQLLSTETDELWHNLQTILRALKISAAAFKSAVNHDEVSVCQSLIEFWIGNNLEHINNKEDGKYKCLLFSLQYFFNLSQGMNEFF